MNARALTAALAVLVSAGSAAHADVISVAWSPVVHAELAGYRVRIESPEGLVGSWDLGQDETAFSAGVLVSGCQTFCVHVSSLSSSGAAGTPSVLCGLPDPEIFDVAAGEDDQFRIVGDNFAPDAQVFLDGSSTPVPSTRVGCGELWIDEAPETSVIVRNPTDGVRVQWASESTEYLFEDVEGAAILECRLTGNTLQPTVTRFVQSPGLGLAVEADEAGLGTDCALAIQRIENADPDETEALALGAGDGWLYFFTFE